MEIIPFSYGEDEDFNEVYTFIFTSDTTKSRNIHHCYYTKITIDGLDDDLIIKKECNCKGFLYKKSCKHIDEGSRLLKEWGINYRENSLNSTMVSTSGCQPED